MLSINRCSSSSKPQFDFTDFGAPDDVLHVQLGLLHPPPDVDQPLGDAPAQHAEAEVVDGDGVAAVALAAVAPPAHFAEQDAHLLLCEWQFDFFSNSLLNVDF